MICSALVPLLWITIFAPPITAPLVSYTVPPIAHSVVDCANASAPHIETKSTAKTKRRIEFRQNVVMNPSSPHFKTSNATASAFLRNQNVVSDTLHTAGTIQIQERFRPREYTRAAANSRPGRFFLVWKRRGSTLSAFPVANGLTKSLAAFSS